MTYHFYLFVGTFPKLFNFSEGKEKSYLDIIKYISRKRVFGLQKILLDNFSQNFYIWSAIVNGTCMQKIKIGHGAKFWGKSKCFLQILFPVRAILRSINFRWAYFDSFSWRVHLGVDCARACSEKLFRASLSNRPQVSMGYKLINPTRDGGRIREKFVNHDPQASGLRILRVFYHHPACGLSAYNP